MATKIKATMKPQYRTYKIGRGTYTAFRENGVWMYIDESDIKRRCGKLSGLGEQCAPCSLENINDQIIQGFDDWRADGGMDFSDEDGVWFTVSYSYSGVNRKYHDQVDWHQTLINLQPYNRADVKFTANGDENGKWIDIIEREEDGAETIQYIRDSLKKTIVFKGR